MMIPVEGHKNLYRDENSGAIINCDKNEYNHYMSLKKEKQRQKNEIEGIKNEISEIKSLLRELLEKNR